MKRFVFCAFCALFFSVSLVANDATYTVSGAHLIPLRQSNIRVQKEVLTISLQDDGRASVDVYYEFKNTGSQPVTVLMGFEANPPYATSEQVSPAGVHPYIHDFTVEMNERRLAYKTALCFADNLQQVDMKQWEFSEWDMDPVLVNKSTDEHREYTSVYSFSATFQPGINKVHHTYSYDVSNSVVAPYYLDYALKPAARWAGGEIEDFTLIIKAEHTAKHFYVNKLGTMKPEMVSGAAKFRSAHDPYSYGEEDEQGNEIEVWEVSLRNGAIRFSQKHFRPVVDLDIASVPFPEPWRKNNVIGEYYDRGVGFSASELLKGVPASQLEFMRKIVRNLPYAHRGRVFTTPEIQRYMESLWWYMPDPNYKDDTSDFTPVDWDYVNADK